jgi:hypothetical protein
MIAKMRSWLSSWSSFPGATVAEKKDSTTRVRELSHRSIGGQTPSPWLMI